MKVFLGGTCNGSKWREVLKPQLSIDYFDPIVDAWCEADRDLEEIEKIDSEIHLYCITPKMMGLYSIFEIGKSTGENKYVCFVIIDNDNGCNFDKSRYAALMKFKDIMIEQHKCFVLDNYSGLKQVAKYLNSFN